MGYRPWVQMETDWYGNAHVYGLPALDNGATMKYDELKKTLSLQAKSRRRPRHIEEDIQTACVNWFRLAYPTFVVLAIPNGGTRNAKEAANMKRAGVLAGAADLLVIGYGAVLFIEMKSAKGKQTELQKKFQKAVERLGHQYAVCHSLQEFQMTIERWIKSKYGYEV